MAFGLTREEHRRAQFELFGNDSDSDEEFLGYGEEDLVVGDGQDRDPNENDDIFIDENELEWLSVGDGEDVIPVWCPAYGQRQGLRVPMERKQPVDFFQLFFTDDLFQHVSTETNTYATHVC